MVCIYCGHKTSVTNSRENKRNRQTWRRRQCATCGSIFTTYESIDYDSSLRVEIPNGKLIPFSREKLLISIFKSCAHRDSAIQDANALADTVVSSVLATQTTKGLVSLGVLRTSTLEVLKRFDNAAATYYAAYHTGK